MPSEVTSQPVDANLAATLAEEKRHEEKLSKLNAAYTEVKESQKEEGKQLSIYDDPPGYWYHLVLFISDSPLEHDHIYRLPILTALAYADKRARDDKAEMKLMEIAMKAGNPMAAFMGRRKR